MIAPPSVDASSHGPLAGVRVLELAGLGPAPFCCMMLADMGADVIRIDRVAAVSPSGAAGVAPSVVGRGRRSLAVDLKMPAGRDLVLDLIDQSDVFIEGFRPGVVERLGLDPPRCLARRPSLIYGRMTGWGQSGPYAKAPGHDINYIALAGALDTIGRAGESPVVPLNLLGDYGGGGMYLAFGVVAALVDVGRFGRGQVVDASMVDGVASLMGVVWEQKAAGEWHAKRGTNLLDSGAPFYDAYRCSDGNYISIGAIEPHFYAELIRLTGLDTDGDLPAQMDRDEWPRMKARFATVFATRSRDEWCVLMEGAEVCFAPVLTPDEAAEHPHNRARGTFVHEHGMVQAAPAPRLSRTPGAIGRRAPYPGQHSNEILMEVGFGERIAELRAAGAIA